MRKMKNKNDVVKLIMPVMIVILFFVVLFQLNFKQADSMEESAFVELEESSDQQMEAISAKIDGKYKLLEVNAEAFGEKGSLDTVQEQGEALDAIATTGGFFSTGFSDIKGHTYTNDGVSYNIEDRNYFKDAIDGKRGIQEIKKPKDGEENAIILSVPVRSGDKITGVLYGRFTELIFADLLMAITYENHGFSVVCDRKGNIIVGNDGQVLFDKNDNFINLFNRKDITTQYKASEVKKNLSKGRGDGISFNYDGKVHYVSYKPFGNTGLYVCTFIPESIIAHGNNKLMDNVILFSIELVLIIVLTAAWALTVNISRRKVLEQEKDRIIKSEAKLRYQAEFDELTGIYSRQGFFHHTSQLLKNNDEKYIIITGNVDNFKIINDIFGSNQGDYVLKQISVTLKEIVGSTGVCGRLEADHFALCCREKDFDIKGMKKAVDKQMNKLFDNYNVVIHFGFYYVKDHKTDVNLMIDWANLALNHGKQKRQSDYAIYDDKLRQTMIWEQEIKREMRYGLDTGQFKVYYQPIYSISNGCPISAEALIRWIHPTKGVIHLDDFIPIFERDGSIAEIDAYVRKTVWKYIKGNLAAGKPVVPISINASRADFHIQDFCGMLGEWSSREKVNWDFMRIEVTESAYMENPAKLKEIFQCLKQHKIKVLMDDFGSGYSSLNMLKDIPVDYLKIDMKFTQEVETSPRAKKVLMGIMQIAKVLDMEVIAEGIETEYQANFMRKIGCDQGQGYYYARPMSQKDFDKLLLDDDRSKALDNLSMEDIRAIEWKEEQSKLYESLLETSNNLVFSYDVRKEFMSFSVSDGKGKKVQGTRENYLEYLSTDQRIVHPDFCQVYRDMLKGAEKEGISGEMEFKADFFQTGEHLWYKVKFYSTEDDFGCVRKVIGIGANVQKEKRLETLLTDEKNVQQAMMREYELVVSVDLGKGKSELIHESEEYNRKFYPYETYATNTGKVNEYIHPEDRERMDLLFTPEGLSEKFSQGECVCAEEFRLKTRSGEWAWIDCDVYMFQKEATKTVNCLIYMEDIDEQKNMEHNARYDGVTKLFNRITFQEKTDALLASENSTGMLLVYDIDDFKLINDTYGHVEGDRVLSAIADIFIETFRSQDVIGRLGGDEFGVFVTGKINDKAAKDKAYVTLEKIENIGKALGLDINVTCSVGASRSLPCGDNFETLYSRSDNALYAAKDKGKNQLDICGVE